MNENSLDIQILERLVDWCNQLVEAMQRFDNDMHAFFHDRTYRNAVSFCVLQIVDLIPTLSDECKAEHSDIQWDIIVRLRTELLEKIVSHSEETINPSFVWHVLQNILPMLYWGGNAIVFQHRHPQVEEIPIEWGDDNPPEKPTWGNPPAPPTWGNPPAPPAWGNPPAPPTCGNPPAPPLWGNPPEIPTWGNPPEIPTWGNPPQDDSGWGKPPQVDSGWTDPAENEVGVKQWAGDPGWNKDGNCGRGEEQAKPFEPAPVIVVVNKEVVIHNLQGEWSSKENGFNYKMVFSGNTLKLGWDDQEMSEMPFDVKPGMPMQIVSPRFAYEFGGDRHHYRVSECYYVNDRIAMFTEDDEVVLSRCLTSEELREIESPIPKLNLVFNPDDGGTDENGADDSSVTDAYVRKTIQGKWVGRDNCNYVIIIEDDQFNMWSNYGYLFLKTKYHISEKHPAHIELEKMVFRSTESQRYDEFVYGVYYLEDNALLLSIHSNCFGNKFEYILRRPEAFGRYVKDDEILPRLQGFWVEEKGCLLAIHGNEIAYYSPNNAPLHKHKESFRVETESEYCLEDNQYILVRLTGDKRLLDYDHIRYDAKNDTIRATTIIMDYGVITTDFKRRP